MEEKKAKKVGRPVGSASRTVFRESVIEDILKGIRIGMTIKSSCINAGVSNDAVDNWLKRAAEGDKRYADFYERCNKAIEEGKAFHLGFVNMHSKGGLTGKKVTKEIDPDTGKVIKIIEVVETLPPNLKASTWILERRHPQEFGPKQEVAVVNGDNPFEVSLFGQALVGSANDEVILPGKGGDEG